MAEESSSRFRLVPASPSSASGMVCSGALVSWTTPGTGSTVLTSVGLTTSLAVPDVSTGAAMVSRVSSFPSASATESVPFAGAVAGSSEGRSSVLLTASLATSVASPDVCPEGSSPAAAVDALPVTASVRRWASSAFRPVVERSRALRAVCVEQRALVSLRTDSQVRTLAWCRSVCAALTRRSATFMAFTSSTVMLSAMVYVQRTEEKRQMLH